MLISHFNYLENIAQHIWLSYTKCEMPSLVGNNNMQ